MLASDGLDGSKNLHWLSSVSFADVLITNSKPDFCIPERLPDAACTTLDFWVPGKNRRVRAGARLRAPAKRERQA